jgi:hypothetical protein
MMINFEFDVKFSRPDAWQSHVIAMDAGSVFVYQGGDRFSVDDAYIIVPGMGDTHVIHEFGGRCLMGLMENRCRLFSWNGPLPKSLNQISDHNVHKRAPEVLSLLQLRWPDAEIVLLEESLVLVRCGDLVFWVATNNRYH